MEKEEYIVGLDMGTNSVAGAAVNPNTYDILKFKGQRAWCVQIFEPGSSKKEARMFRTARRRLDRRKQRVKLVQMLFAEAIGAVDERFFVRLKESELYPEEGKGTPLFNDANYTDKQYYAQYPTIHHLICDLMKSTTPHDVRLVYLACAWLVAHRGHFLNNMDMEHLRDIQEFDAVYDQFCSFFSSKGYDECWTLAESRLLGDILKLNAGVSTKEKQLKALLFGGKNPSKEWTAEFPFNRGVILKLLAGGKASLEQLFFNEGYKDLGSISLDMEEEKFEECMTALGEDYELIDVLRAMFDWATLVKVLGDARTISEAKVKAYEQHKADLKTLKTLLKKYATKEEYNNMFRKETENSYTAYVYHTDGGYMHELKKRASKDDFLKNVKNVLGKIEVEEKDRTIFDEVMERIAVKTFMPKQKNTDNRVIPYQLYFFELREILKKASSYLPFLKQADEEGIAAAQKIESVFAFRVPYFVGPLNPNSERSWIREYRKEGKIYPWNFDSMVDLDGCENAFISKLTNSCSYLPGETVLPKDSLCYHRYMVLNEINNLRINGVKISVETKQAIYNELFLQFKKVTKRKLWNWLVANGHLRKDDNDDVISGIDETIKSDLAPQIAYADLIKSGKLSEKDVEKIIERASYAEDKGRLVRWLKKEYRGLSEEDIKYIGRIKAKDFGRLSQKLLCELEGVNKETGEITTVMSELWNSNNNLMEILEDSGKYTFKDEIKNYVEDFYSTNSHSLEERLDDMHVAPAVRRPIVRALDIVKDFEKAFGAPAKIFVEVTRGATEEQRGKRTKTRKEQILELYQECKEEDVRLLRKQLEDMGESADNRLQGDKLFLYFIQFGKSAYSGKEIDLESLGNPELYDIDHIYPQSIVMDDSILNNKVLCLSKENGAKSDRYPIDAEIRQKMTPFWAHLRDCGLMTDEKYKRLVRTTPFTDEEKYEFINRQLTETSQAAKAIAVLLKEKYPGTEIVYSKARNVSEFRKTFDCLKSREFNDLHHAVDAYLNVVVGNVYQMKFSKQWFRLTDKYNMKTEKIFENSVVCGGKVVWSGRDMVDKVVKIAREQNGIHFSKYAYFKKGGLFDQMPVKKGEGLVPIKAGKETTKYGGYNKLGTMFFIPVKYRIGKKTEIFIMSVDLINGEHFLSDEEFAIKYSFSRIEKLLGKQAEEVSFPLGMRPWKVNTMLSLDGYKVCVTGSAAAGRSLIVQTMTQFEGKYEWQYYIKKIAAFCEKMRKNPKYIYDSAYDEVNDMDNLALYDYYVSKLENTIYRKRVNNPAFTLKEGKNRFVELDVVKQCMALLCIQQVFGRIAGGCDLRLVGGGANAAATNNFSASISNWKKNYSDVRIVDVSPSGLWEKQSENLLELV